MFYHTIKFIAKLRDKRHLIDIPLISLFFCNYCSLVNVLIKNTAGYSSSTVFYLHYFIGPAACLLYTSSFVSLIPIFFKPRFMISSINRCSGTRQLLPAKAGKPNFLIRGVELLLRAIQFKDQLRASIL